MDKEGDIDKYIEGEGDEVDEKHSKPVNNNNDGYNYLVMQITQTIKHNIKEEPEKRTLETINSTEKEEENELDSYM